MPLTGAELLQNADSSAQPKCNYASTSCSSIDDLAGGGFKYGAVTSIAGESDIGKTLIAIQVVAGHVIGQPDSTVAIIDTDGSFPLELLHDVVIDRLSSQQSGATAEELPTHLVQCLGRIEIMRCFDFVGLLEAIGEIQEKCVDTHQSHAETSSEGAAKVGYRKPQMLIVDNVANVIQAELSKDQVEGFAFIASFHRKLRRITQEYQLCSLLINTVVIAERHSSETSLAPVLGRRSVFQSVSAVPALGNAYAHIVDLSILLSRLPKTREDAEALYAYESHQGVGWESAVVAEVLFDHFGARDGSWAAFEIRGSELRPLERSSLR